MSIPVCASCGALRRAADPTCSRCGAPTGIRQAEASNPDASSPVARNWVCFEGHFECRSCGHDVPLNHLDLDGSVLCNNCHVDQAFRVDTWSEALDHAHAVADLGGPHRPPPGDPTWSALTGDDVHYAQLGESATKLTISCGGAFSNAPAWEIVVSPGTPLCERCQTPVQAQLATDGSCQLRCGGCGWQAPYRLPPEANRFDELVAAVAPAHRADRSDARVQIDPAGVASLQCPQCQAPLQPSSDDQLVTCSYCNTTSRVSPRFAQRAGGGAEPRRRWWLLFRGPSAVRKKAEVAAARTADPRLGAGGALPCPTCQRPNPPHFEFCGGCGSDLNKAPARIGAASSGKKANPYVIGVFVALAVGVLVVAVAIVAML